MRHESHASRIAKAISRIRDNLHKPLAVGELAQQCGMSTSSFHAHFKSVTATSPLQYQKELRLLKARTLLRNSDHGVSEVAYQVGYESPTQFTREFSRKFGVPPRDDRLLSSWSV